MPSLASDHSATVDYDFARNLKVLELDSYSACSGALPRRRQVKVQVEFINLFWDPQWMDCSLDCFILGQGKINWLKVDLDA